MARRVLGRCSRPSPRFRRRRGRRDAEGRREGHPVRDERRVRPRGRDVGHVRRGRRERLRRRLVRAQGRQAAPRRAPPDDRAGAALGRRQLYVSHITSPLERPRHGRSPASTAGASPSTRSRSTGCASGATPWTRSCRARAAGCTSASAAVRQPRAARARGLVGPREAHAAARGDGLAQSLRPRVPRRRPARHRQRARRPRRDAPARGARRVRPGGRRRRLRLPGLLRPGAAQLRRHARADRDVPGACVDRRARGQGRRRVRRPERLDDPHAPGRQRRAARRPSDRQAHAHLEVARRHTTRSARRSAPTATST